jgi:hypothetical protein
MRQKTKNNRNQGSNEKKFFFGFVPKSPTQMGLLSAKNASKKFSRLGTFKRFTNTGSVKAGIGAQSTGPLKTVVIRYPELRPGVCVSCVLQQKGLKIAVSCSASCHASRHAVKLI